MPADWCLAKAVVVPQRLQNDRLDEILGSIPAADIAERGSEQRRLGCDDLAIERWIARRCFARECQAHAASATSARSSTW